MPALRLAVALTVMAASLAAAPLFAETLRGKVVGVTDGDTVRLLVNGRDLYKVRLGEIDAPENGQPFGRASKRMLSDLVFGQVVSARVTDVDRYGRSVAVLTRGGTNINAELVRKGGAWAYRRYLSDQRYLMWERDARNGRRGLWRLQPDQIMAPWDWRAARRGGAGSPRPTVSVGGTGLMRRPATAMSAAASACEIRPLCRQMTSCEAARYQLRVCGARRLDSDGDGVPCEKLCG